MFLIAEKVNVITTTIREAMKAKDKKPIQEMVELQLEGNPDCIDINLGPATRNGPEMMQWMVETIEDVTDLILSLDTMNMDAMEAGLEKVSRPAIVNSISFVPERLKRLVPMAIKHNAKVVGLCTSEAGVPRDENERFENAMNLMSVFATGADMMGEPIVEIDRPIPLDDYWIDPIVLPIGVAQDQVIALRKSTRMYSELPEPPHLVCGLSNVSNKCGLTPEDAGLVNRIYLAVLMGYGMDAAIVDPNDEKLMAVAKKESPEYEWALIAEGLKEGELDPNDEEQLAVEKTVRLFQDNAPLFAASYLEL
ncbi:MAG: dihydropteroate synthase [Actinobacteria bacterium]|nr:dihydropteroate synthase [Actinomycetota bacterium]MBU4386172.1 dihydropteroate synthase [Actinomycetota bacterium]MBU4489902.1 dihydropteroate synthase [Actinomycetota bacterium]MCG2795435.1 dihydropteroate synthase [Actinomycetes bacterium]